MLVHELISKLSKLNQNYAIGVNVNSNIYRFDDRVDPIYQDDGVALTVANKVNDINQLMTDSDRHHTLHLDDNAPVLIIKTYPRYLRKYHLEEIFRKQGAYGLYTTLNTDKWLTILGHQRKIRPERLAGIENAVVVNNGTIVLTAGLDQHVEFNTVDATTNFKLTNYGVSDSIRALHMKHIMYLTNNPITIKSFGELKQMIDEP